MNILILNWRDPKNPKSGGAEQVTFEHAKRWVEAGHTVTWFTSYFLNAKKEETIDGVSIIRKGGAYTVYLLTPFYYFFCQKNFDIVIDEIHGIPFFTPLYVRKPKIAFIHEVAGEIWDYMYPFPINVFGKIFESFYFLFYKDIFFWTDAPSTITDLEKHGIKKEECIAIPCPPGNKSLDKLPQKETSPTYIFVSRLVKMKGIENILKTFKLIVAEKPQAKLWIVGGGEASYMKTLETKIKNCGIAKNVTFYGYVSNQKKLELMRRAHILLHASVKEGWGLVVLEAASQATPAVVYNVPGLCDVVKNGKTGTVIKRNTPDEMAKEAVKLFENKKRYSEYQKNGLAWASSLRWDTVAKDSLQLLERHV